MDTKALRQKILDLAIHGRLVPQDPNDEPASALLARIHAEKEQLIKEGKIKKPKKSTKTADKPYYAKTPFEVPKGWEWTTLGEISNYGACKNIETKDIPQEAWVLELEDIEKDSARIVRKYTRKEREAKGIRHSFAKGDVLYSKLRTYLNKVLVAPEDGYCTPEIVPITCCPSINPMYLNIVLRSKYFLSYTALCGYGVKMPRLSTEDACNGMIPLPPRKEQNRIVSYTRLWFKAIDSLEENQLDLRAAIKQAKSKILDLAIHGKLVPQDPNDEPASELLHRINPKAAPMCDTGQYGNLPNGWALSTLSEMCVSTNGLWKGKKAPFINVGVVRNANFTKDFKLDYSKIEYLDVEKQSFEKRNLHNGDLIIEKSGGSEKNPVGRAILYEGKDSVLSFSNFTMSLRIKHKGLLDYKFLYYLLQRNYQRGDTVKMQTQTTGLHNLIQKKFMAAIVPLPPIAEQKRIVARVEELFHKLKEIESALSE